MKRVVFGSGAFAALLGMLAVVVLLLPGGASTVSATPGDVYVDASNAGDPLEDGSLAHPFDLIQEGINAALAGDTVHVAAGTYYEHVTIGKSLTLAGADRNTTIMDGGGSGNIVHITADNAEMSGFTVRNGHYGIFLDSANGNTISDVKVISQISIGGSTGVGIRLDHGASNNTIANSESAYNGAAGIDLWDWDGQRNNTITDCKMHHNAGSGIRGYITTDGTQVIRCNVHHNAKYGILVGWSSWTIRDSNIYANEYDGIRPDVATYTVIEDNNIHTNGWSGVTLDGMGAHDSTVRRNNLCWNAESGAAGGGPSYNNSVYHNNIY